MARPLSILHPGAWYHLTARGIERRALFRDDRDRAHFLELLEELVAHLDVALHALVLRDNHYPLLLETRRPNLSQAIPWLNVSHSVRTVRTSAWRGAPTGCSAPGCWNQGGGSVDHRAQQYRSYVEKEVREGLPLSPWEELRDWVALGGARFWCQLQESAGGSADPGAPRARLGAGEGG